MLSRNKLRTTCRVDAEHKSRSTTRCTAHTIRRSACTQDAMCACLECTTHAQCTTQGAPRTPVVARANHNGALYPGGALCVCPPVGCCTRTRGGCTRTRGGCTCILCALRSLPSVLHVPFVLHVVLYVRAPITGIAIAQDAIKYFFL